MNYAPGDLSAANGKDFVMSITSIGRRGRAGHHIPTGLVFAVQRLCAALITWRTEQAAIMTLRSMSDHELNDLGLPRSEIASAVKATVCC